MISPYRQRILALSAVFQAAALAERLAWEGPLDPDVFRFQLESIFRLENDRHENLGGEIRRWETGLATLEAGLTLGAPGDKSQMRATQRLRYAMGLLYLERQLTQSVEIEQLFQQRIRQSQQQLPFFQDGITGQAMVHKLAGIYVDTLGTLKHRIQVRGSEQRLKTSGVAEQIRACLLAGVCAARLWRRLGGRRWHLLLTRRRILSEIRAIIRETRQADANAA